MGQLKEPPGPVGSVSQPNRVLQRNLESFRPLFSPVGFICLGCFFSRLLSPMLKRYKIAKLTPMVQFPNRKGRSFPLVIGSLVSCFCEALMWI